MQNNIFKTVFIGLSICSVLFSCANEEKDLPISEIYLDIPEGGYEIKVNDTIVISPKITYDYGSSYTWLLDDEIISTDKDYKLIPKELNTFNYTFIVENQRGTVSREIFAQSMYNSDFEDLTLEKDTFSVGTVGTTQFSSGLLSFEVNGDPKETSSFDGFVYSDITGSNTNVLYQLYGEYRSTDDYDSENYVVLGLNDPNKHGTITTLDSEDHLFKSMYVNNTYYNYTAIEQGIGSIEKFGGTEGTDPDWFKMIINGYDTAGTLKGTVEFYLADHTAITNKDDYTIREWTNVDLTELGYISRIEISFLSTDIFNGEMLTPAYVCIDNIKVID
ncbi:DUF4465 domain-containing protein [Plebeiibacterium sediminum]|uniref:DUF4465 domain-containing protein n=1 Tax=Plebeiibacterium sediminum TaxID=2992112 RepID=A0AAE3M4K5_9BACT|nr:DUF4465 domain-containing protein [Plebeiobacterium sediminum]MCW3786923.1 DUF4465 domain-containing protein [Plebeiobacterium sediminum]